MDSEKKKELKSQPYDYAPPLQVTADSNKELTSISLNPSVVDIFFNTYGIDGERFVDNFMEAYNITVTEPFSDYEFYGWEFVSPDGYKVKIYSDKSIKIQSVAKEKELTFD